MSLLFESIKVEDGRFFNLRCHGRRLNDSRRELFGCKEMLDLTGALALPDGCRKGLYKCRVSYSEIIHGITFEPYSRRAIGSLKIVHDEEIEYPYKFENKSGITRLLSLKEKCDDILIVKNGLVTDTSFSNIAFFDGDKWLTPSVPLLKGTRRERLISDGMLVEEQIRVEDIRLFSRASLINAMLDRGETVLAVDAIY